MRDKLFAVAVFKEVAAEVVLRRLMPYLLEGDIKTAVEQGTRNRYQDSQLLLSNNNAETISHICDEPDHLRSIHAAVL